MERFVRGTTEQFNELARMLEDGCCHVFKDCKLPSGTTPDVTRIGFEKTSSGYKVMVDLGIVTEVASSTFKDFLAAAEADFNTIADMRAFFNGFSPVFDAQEVVNAQMVEELRKKQMQPKYVHPEEICRRLKEEIFGQDHALDKISHEICAHLIAPADRPLVLSLLGPCGVGKSATARLLAAILTDLYDVKYGFISESGNTIKGEHAIQKFLGAPPSYIGHGQPTVFDPVRTEPNHVIVIDEIEKAHPDLLVILMEALDTGYLSMNDNSPKIDLRSCIIIFTSNLPVQMDKYAALDDFEQTTYCRDLFTEFTGKPEITRRISEFIVYNELTDSAKLPIIIGYLKDELANYGAKLQKVDENLMVSFLEMNARYGASELRSCIRKAVSYKLAEMETNDAFRGKKIRLSGIYKNIVIEVDES